MDIISGAGVGGVATAARLAKAGLQVSLYEKNDYYGGKCSNIVHNGYVSLGSLQLKTTVDFFLSALIVVRQ